jgi:hypothetical protein
VGTTARTSLRRPRHDNETAIIEAFDRDADPPARVDFDRRHLATDGASPPASVAFTLRMRFGLIARTRQCDINLWGQICLSLKCEGQTSDGRAASIATTPGLFPACRFVAAGRTGVFGLLLVLLFEGREEDTCDESICWKVVQRVAGRTGADQISSKAL